MNDKVSVVTVCFNVELEIEKTIQSILNQNYQTMEYIIKDGNSLDRTNEIINKYKPLFQEKGILVKHIISKDKGIFDAMNIAAENCTGEWIIFMNAGDSFYNATVLFDVFNNKDWDNSDILYGHTLMRISENRGYIVNHSAFYLEEGMSLCHQSLFVRKELILKFPFDYHYQIKADYDQMIRLKRNGKVFTGVNIIISDRSREGVSNDMVAQRNKEDNILSIRYQLNWKKKSVILGYMKQIIKKVFPQLTILWSIQKREKNILKYKLKL